MHTVTEIEERIRRRYHQPKGVEQFGIEPVPQELKTVRWHDIFSIIFGFALNPGSMLVGGMAVVSGLSFWGAVGAITSGVLLATIAYTITATVGVDYGLPGQVSMRMVYGLRGAKWVPSFLRTIASTYWFAYQTVAGSLAVVAILDRWTGTPHSLVTVSVIFAVLQAIVAIIGYDSLKHLSRIALPFKILILSFVLVLLGTHSDPNYAPSAVFHYAGKPEAEKHSASMSVVKKAEVQHPISHENTTTEQLVNQTLNMLKPIERAINESHNCIIEAVICGNSTLANKPMLRL